MTNYSPYANESAWGRWEASTEHGGDVEPWLQPLMHEPLLEIPIATIDESVEPRRALSVTAMVHEDGPRGKPSPPTWVPKVVLSTG